ncbi:MAG TPA: NAD(P)/FAD-dependent oxidoreductase [Acidimicrobiales bacterium]|nr:NAD(P)/FAD-dependent oxidoreductase [Acidimicrobiales bacterium]
MRYDLVVIGGGAAGLSAARTARRRNASVAIVSAGPLGGDCTFYGCVPSKTLIESTNHGLNFSAAMDRVRAVVERISHGEDAAVLRGEGIDVIQDVAHFQNGATLAVGGSELAYGSVVIATGSEPLVPPVAGIGHVPVLTNETVFALRQRPVSLLVIGGGPVGVELGQAFARLGTKTTIVETAARVLSHEEPEASAVVEASLRVDGVDVRTGRQVKSLSGTAGSISAALDDGSSIVIEQVLVAAGRKAVTAALDLGQAGVRLDQRGYISTDAHLRTSVKGIYAAGDVTGRALLTHAADEMGRVAANNALSRVAWRKFRQDAIPAVTYTSPEVARVGLTEDQAAAVPGARVAELPLEELDRAITAGRTDGYIKLIASPRFATGNLAGGRLIGATVVAERAGEMIAVPVLAMRSGMLPARLALTVQAYPTWALGVRQAAAQLFVETGGRRARPTRRAAAS